MTRSRVIFLIFFALLYVSETINAQSKSPTAPKINQAPSPTPTPQGNINQPINQPPTNPSLPSIEHYQKLVEMVHKEVEEVRSVYTWLAGILGVIISVGIALGVFLTYKSIGELKDSINRDSELHLKMVTSEIERRIQEHREMLENMTSDMNNTKSEIGKYFSAVKDTVEKAHTSFDDHIKKMGERGSKFMDGVENNINEYIKDLIRVEMANISKNEQNI